MSYNVFFHHTLLSCLRFIFECPRHRYFLAKNDLLMHFSRKNTTQKKTLFNTQKLTTFKKTSQGWRAPVWRNTHWQECVCLTVRVKMPRSLKKQDVASKNILAFCLLGKSQNFRVCVRNKKEGQQTGLDYKSS